MSIAVVGLVVEGISVAATAATTVMSTQAANRQAAAAAQAANYNAKLDIANAQQQAMNAQANIAKQRQDDKSYQSNQRAALAASGVLSGTGSPMALQATTAGRQEQDIQQYWTSTQQHEATQYAAAQEGVYEGAEAADTYHLQGAADIFKGIGSIGGEVYQGYKDQQGYN